MTSFPGTPGPCPACSAIWEYNVDVETFSRVIGIEDPAIYDGVSWWKCPDCGIRWDRWTKQEAE
jgi:hypothetical protein